MKTVVGLEARLCLQDVWHDSVLPEEEVPEFSCEALVWDSVMSTPRVSKADKARKKISQQNEKSLQYLFLFCLALTIVKNARL